MSKIEQLISKPTIDSIAKGAIDNHIDRQETIIDSYLNKEMKTYKELSQIDTSLGNLLEKINLISS